MSSLKELLHAVKLGELDVDSAMKQIRGNMIENLGHTRIDHDRLDRVGAAEVIYGAGKTIEQLLDIVASMQKKGSNVLITRIQEKSAQKLLECYENGSYCSTANIFRLYTEAPQKTETKIVVATGGTSDMSVAEEAALTAEFYGNQVERVYDVGVAGLHRLLNELPTIHEAKVIIAVAGMEGALPSVVAGLVKVPVIAVPTSVGYGANFEGITPLLAMLNSCASGISVVNINNGFGAAYLASMINHI